MDFVFNIFFDMFGSAKTMSHRILHINSKIIAPFGRKGFPLGDSVLANRCAIWSFLFYPPEDK